MANLTKDQARELANHLRDFATRISDYRAENAGEFSPEEKESLDKDIAKLFNQAAELRREAAGILFTDLEKAMENIQATTTLLGSAVQNIENAGKCIDYATLLVAFAGAIATGNAVAIASASAGIISAVREDGEGSGA